jgi:CRISPR/Cas system-associated endoribonuclease Cas2
MGAVMITVLKAAAYAGVMIFASSAGLWAQSNQFRCSVNTFLTDGGEEHREINSEKNFLISSSEDRIFVTSICPACEDGQTVFTIIHKTPVGVYGVELNYVGLQTISLNSDNTSVVISDHNSFYVNVWQLDCSARW